MDRWLLRVGLRQGKAGEEMERRRDGWREGGREGGRKLKDREMFKE